MLEEICNDSKSESCYVSRYIGTENQGEKLELYIEDYKEFQESLLEYVGEDFKVIEWDKKKQL